MYAVGVPVLCVLRGLPARKEQQKEKARTSFSKGERQRESKGKDKHSKEIYSPMLRTSRGGSRKANQIASEKQIASSKHEVRRRKNEAKHDVIEAQHDSEAKHDVVEARRQAKHDVSHAHAYLLLNCKLLAKSFFPFAPPFRPAVRPCPRAFIRRDDAFVVEQPQERRYVGLVLN